MVLRHPKPAYISLTARRAQPAGPPPTQPTTTTTQPAQMREINDPGLTNVSPYQFRVGANAGVPADRAAHLLLANSETDTVSAERWGIETCKSPAGALTVSAGAMFDRRPGGSSAWRAAT